MKLQTNFIQRNTQLLEPTMTDDIASQSELLELLQLNLIPGVGPRLRQQLLERFETPAEILSASRNRLLEVDGVGQKIASAIIAAHESNDAQQELNRCREEGIQLLTPEMESYPRMLTEICDPPGVLYCRGKLEPRDRLSIAIVGSRRCTLYGRQQAEKLSGALARSGITIVSGLARGIDAVAHRAAIAAGGRTIAVAATGLGTVYPPEHKELADDVVSQGAIITESPFHQPPVAGLFPQRNRIISGMSLGVIIIEASKTSGSLHTARHAMEQGREVFAVPGRIDSLPSEGCHNLIRDGATLVRNVDDVFESLGPLVEPVTSGDGSAGVHDPRELTLNDQEREVLALVTTEPRSIDLVLHDSELDPSRVLATLTVLEMKRLVHRMPGGQLVRAAR